RKWFPKARVWMSPEPCSISPFRPTMAALPYASAGEPSASSTRGARRAPMSEALESIPADRSSTNPCPAQGFLIMAASTATGACGGSVLVPQRHDEGGAGVGPVVREADDGFSVEILPDEVSEERCVDESGAVFNLAAGAHYRCFAEGLDRVHAAEVGRQDVGEF